MGRRNDHSREQIREMALDAAVALLASAGPSGLSARKVAIEIGYTVGTLYLVFDNFDDLILQMNLRTLKQLRSQIVAACDASQTPIDQLKAIAAAYIKFARDHEHPWRMIYEHPLPAYGDKPISAALEEYKIVSRSLFTHIENILGPLLGRETEADPHRLSLHARALWGGVHGVCILSLAGKLDQGDSDALGVMAELLIERFVSGQQG